MAGLITVLILLPLVGALFVSVEPGQVSRVPSRSGSTLLSAIAAFLFVAQFRQRGGEDCNSSERHEWIPSIGAEYLVGVDGLSLLLVMLTSLIFPFALLAKANESRRLRTACS